MSDGLARLVMKAAATELLHEEAAQIDQEMRRLLAEMEPAPACECRGILLQRFLDLLQRRGEVAKKALILREKSESGATFTARIWPIQWQGQFDASPSIEAFSSEGRVVTPAAEAYTPMNKRHACDAGNRAISRLHRSAGRSIGLTQDDCRAMQVRRIEVPEGCAERTAAQLLQRVSSECSVGGEIH
jgi:hypothetical protein